MGPGLGLGVGLGVGPEVVPGEEPGLGPGVGLGVALIKRGSTHRLRGGPAHDGSFLEHWSWHAYSASYVIGFGRAVIVRITNWRRIALKRAHRWHKILIIGSIS